VSYSFRHQTNLLLAVEVEIEIEIVDWSYFQTTLHLMKAAEQRVWMLIQRRTELD